MARIPIYDQQQVPSGGLSVPSSQVGAAQAVGRGLQAVGEGLRRLDAGLERRDEVKGALWAAQASSEADLAQSEYLIAKQNEAPPGADGFADQFLKDYDAYAEKALQNAPNQYARTRLQAHLAQSRELYARQALVFQAQESARYQGEQIDTGVQASSKLVTAQPELAERELGKWMLTIDQLEVPPAARAALREQARKNIAWYATVGEIDQNPAAWANGAPEGAGATWNLLDADEQAKALRYAEGKLAEIRQESAVSIRYDIQNAEAMARAGVAPVGPPRSRAEFGVAFPDPQVADFEYARYTAARQTGEAVAAMTSKPTSELLEILQQRPDPNDPQFAVTAEAVGIQARAAAGIVEARAKDPAAYAIQTGDFGLQPIDPNDPEALAEELKRRAAALPGMLEKYGTGSVLASNEAEALAGSLAILPADRKVEQLEAIRTSVADDLVYGTVMNAIRKDSPVTALVGNIAAVGSRENARMIARGEDLLNPKDGRGSFPMPTESFLRQQWVSVVGDAYRGYPEAEATAYQAYKAYYAAEAARRGLNDPASGVDSEVAEMAATAATGGVMRWRTDWFGNDTPSASIVLPYGMDESTFVDRVSAEWLRIRDGLGYAQTDVGDIGLYNTGANGEYMVMSGESWLPGPDGRPVTIRVGGQ